MSYLGLETVKPTKPMKRGDLYSFPITTIDQIVTDEETNERLPEYLANNFGMDLLWQNASPKSSFNAQSITISGLENAENVGIVTDWNSNASSYQVSEIQTFKIDRSNPAKVYMLNMVNAPEYSIRTFTINGNVITFSTGKHSNGSSNAAFLVPQQIYDVK